MSKHASPATTIWFPNQRVLRTMFQSIIGLVPITAGILLILAEQWPVQWLIVAAGFGVGVQSALAKVMALPGVNDWLSRHTPLGSAPRTDIAELEQQACNDADAKAQRELRPLD